MSKMGMSATKIGVFYNTTSKRISKIIKVKGVLPTGSEAKT